MGTSQSKKNFVENEKCGIGVSHLCGRPINNDFISRDTDKNEVIFSKTYSYPKGTYTEESTKFFNENEKILFYFSEGENIAAIRYMTITGVHINILDQDRTSPLHIACKSGSLQLVEEILYQGAMINLPDIVGWTSLHVACFYKRSDVILLLLKNGANLNIKNRDGIFPIELVTNDQNCLDIINNFILHSQKEDSHKTNRYNYHSNDNNCMGIDFCIESDNENEDDKYNYYDDTNYKTPNNRYISFRKVDENNIDLKKSHSILKMKMSLLNKKIKVPLPKNSKSGKVSHRSFINGHEAEKENADTEKHKEDQQRILDSYKVIPKKHKFYMNYKNNLRESENNRGSSNRNWNMINNSKSQNLVILKAKTTCRIDNLISSEVVNKKNVNMKVSVKKVNTNSNINTNSNAEVNNFKKSKTNINGPSKNTVIRLPKAFPITHNLNKLKETIKIDKKDYNTVNNLRFSYNNPLDIPSRNNYFKDYRTNPFEIKLKNEATTHTLSQDENEGDCESELSNPENEYNGNHLLTYNYNIDNDSEKYKKYDSSPNDTSEDSFEIDMSMIKENNNQLTDLKGNFQHFKSFSNRNKNKSRNKSFVHKIDQNTEKKVNSDLEEETICLQHNDFERENYHEDSIVFSEEVANFKPKLFPISINEVVMFNDRGIKIFDKPETEYFLTKIKFAEIFLNIFKMSMNTVENILCKFFCIDSNFGLLFLLNILDTENKCDKLINSLRNTITNKDLIGLFLTSGIKEEQHIQDIKKVIAAKFFDSFDINKTNLKENLKNCFKLFSITTVNNSSIIKVDQLAKIFAKSFYKNLNKNEDKQFLLSELSIYNLVFALLVIDIDISEDRKSFNPKSNANINKKFVDLMIILKNLNEGENYENAYIKDFYKFSKLIGFCNVSEGVLKNYAGKKKPVGLYKNGKYEQFQSLYLSEGLMLLFVNKNSDVICMMVYIKNKNFYNYKLDYNNSIMTIESKQQKKNLLIFKNKFSYIKYKKYNSLLFKFESEEYFNDIIEGIKKNV